MCKLEVCGFKQILSRSSRATICAAAATLVSRRTRGASHSHNSRRQPMFPFAP